MSSLKLGIAFDRLRWEEKALKNEAEKLGLSVSLIDAKTLCFEVTEGGTEGAEDAILQRCISHHRALTLTRVLESSGRPVINRYAVAEVTGNKMATSIALARAKVPTPRTFVAMSSETVERAAEELGFPVVLKPFTGSWGRLVSIVRDRSTLQSIVELREELPNPLDHMYYIQEYVRRPPRDIRAVVAGDEIIASVYRYAPEGDWRTNVARGGVSKSFKPEKALIEMILRAAEAVGGGVLGVDAMESPDGYLVHEVNNTVEFRGAQSATSRNIPREIAKYVLSVLKR